MNWAPASHQGDGGLKLGDTCGVCLAQQPQQTGVPFIMRQQVQPAAIMVEQQSQQA